jgi:hypothetical protein
MLKFHCIIFVFFVSLYSNAQKDNEDLISRYRPGTMWFFTGLRPARLEKVTKYDRLMFDVTYNSWNGRDRKPFENNWASIGFNTSLMFDIPLTKGNTISFGTGLTHSLFRIQHNNLLKVDSTNTFTQFQLKDSLQTFDRSFVGGNTLSVPLEFRFRTKKWQHFKVHIGGKIGYQLNMFSKEITEGLNGKEIDKNNGFPDVNHLVYSAHMRIGIRNWALFGSYNFNSLFSNSASSKLNLLQVGVTISLF